MHQNDSARSRQKNVWDKFDIITRALAVVAIPVVIATVGNSYSVAIKDSENRVRYVELAISMLSAPPTTETTALRGWAVELLDSQAPVRLSDEAKDQLRTKRLPIELSATAKGFASASGTATLSAGKAQAN